MNGEGQEGKGGVFTGEAGESVFAFLVAIHVLATNSKMRRYQERHTLAAARGAGGEAAEDKDQDIIYEMSTLFLLLVASSSILTRMWWSGAGDRGVGAVARIRVRAPMEA